MIGLDGTLTFVIMESIFKGSSPGGRLYWLWDRVVTVGMERRGQLENNLRNGINRI